MSLKVRSRLTFANAISVLALFVALGGSSYAAPNMTGKDVKNGSLSGKDLRNNSVTGADVKKLGSGDVRDGSLLAADFGPGQLPQGPKGEPGPNGAATVVVRAQTTRINVGSPHTTSVYANCAAGEKATGGGSDYPGGINRPSPTNTGATPTGWQWQYSDQAGNWSITRDVTVYAVCVS